MAYNNTNHQDLLLGQAVGSTVELWVWDGKDWKKLWGGDSSAVGSPQYLAAMGNGEILGMGLATYEWLSGTWKLVTQQAPPQIAGNVSQDSAGHVLVYGAVDANNPYRTWLFDGSKWTSYASTPGSPGLIDGAMGYDSNHNQTLYFGGEQDLSSETLNSNNTWLWDATAHTWNQVG